MNKLFKLLITLLVILFFNACTPDPITINVDQAEPTMVVSSQIIPEEYMIVAVTRSFSKLANYPDTDNLEAFVNFLTENDLLVKHADVIISYDDVIDTLFEIEELPGIYVSENVLQKDFQTYKLKIIDRETNKEINAITTMQPKIEFDYVNISIDKSKNKDNVFLEYVIKDQDPNNKNFYMVNIYKTKKENFDQNSFNADKFIRKGADKNLITELVNDDMFNNNKYQKKTQLFGVSTQDTIAISISQIEKGYYDFLTAQQKASKLFNIIAGEVVNYPTNIVGGQGYFVAHIPKFYYFEIANY